MANADIKAHFSGDNNRGFQQGINYGKIYNTFGDRSEDRQGEYLAKLPYAEGAAFDSYLRRHDPQCLPNTRVELLQQVRAWTDEPGGRCTFWLHGMAGTGKSTIARTVAHELSRLNLLGASFFFSRGGGDLARAAKFFTSLAVQLAKTSPAVKQHVCIAVAENPDITQQAPRDQWRKLILQPLSSLEDGLIESRRLVLVIDALDECEGEDDVRQVLQLLAETKELKTVRLLTFVTSRPETAVRHGFRRASGVYQDFVLHNIEQSIVERDILIFLEHELDDIRQQRALPAGWPGQQKIKDLVRRAGGLFIWAATVCRFIRGGRNLAERRLTLVLKGGTAGLDSMYTTILKDSMNGQFDEEEEEEVSRLFRKIIGSIIVLSETLSTAALASLLDEPRTTVDGTLGNLRSVLDMSDGQGCPIRLLHPSFRDFLLSKERCSDPQFWVDEGKAHRELADSCLRVMSRGLRKDMCGLQKPGALASEVERSTVERCVPTELQYACRYWVHHLQQSDSGLGDGSRVYSFLQEHFLHWLEALSLIGKMSEGVLMVAGLQMLLAREANPALMAMLQDVRRFMLAYRLIIKQAPL
ncbi:hypothetical protein W97_02964 [Coniosporium apollinis CBS 100218]|uniref:NACHT domain-containing protein n=1 Tax=Coniosporium apollinis (strain CBS 100218) TaxID=1168221 RepID=R7YQ06_CONA1|nr:uncharacterized protein W97_02964 [Coniosporium apollinis CBS 100218]EON63736.1 hypothetical protein W97_02964 [Coniosporium apollinis CBS 100218]